MNDDLYLTRYKVQMLGDVVGCLADRSLPSDIWDKCQELIEMCFEYSMNGYSYRAFYDKENDIVVEWDKPE